jgi:hypothetical protein
METAASQTQAPPADATATLVDVCPANSITSFPLDITFRPTDVNYNSVLETISPMEFTWATEKEVLEGKSETFVHWKGNKYVNMSTQIVGPTHSKWLLTESNPANNVADFIMTFQTTAEVVSYKFITIIIPLIKADVPATSAPEFLRRFADPAGTGEYTLRTMYPQSPTTMFVSYATCLRGYSTMKSPEMVSVFVAPGGLAVSSDIMDTIKSSRFPQKFPPYSPPYMTRLSTSDRQTVGTKTMAFQDFIQTTNQLLNYENVGKQYKDVSKAIREDSLDAYQCVPLDPDRNIEDGKIKVDLDTGEVLSDVVAERNALRTADAVKGSMEPGRLEKYMGTAIGIILGIIFFSLILYFAWSWLRRATGYSALDGMAVPAAAIGVGAASAGITESWAQNIPKYGLLMLLAGFGGFIIGAMLS